MVAVAPGRCRLQGSSRVSPLAIAASVGDVVRVMSRCRKKRTLLMRSRVYIPSCASHPPASGPVPEVHDGTLRSRAVPVHGEATLPEDVDDHRPDPLHVQPTALRSAPEGHRQLAGPLGTVNVLLGVEAEPMQ